MAAKAMRQAAEEVEAAALEAAEMVQKAEQGAEKFRQLQAMLQS